MCKRDAYVPAEPLVVCELRPLEPRTVAGARALESRGSAALDATSAVWKSFFEPVHRVQEVPQEKVTVVGIVQNCATICGKSIVIRYRPLQPSYISVCG